LIIHDDMARRATELDLEFRVRRTYHMETVPRNALLGPRGDGIVAATIPTSTRVGFPLHAVDSIGNVTRSFGYDGRPFREDMVSLFRRGLAPVAGTRTFWAHHLVEYGFARCHLDSLVCEQFVRIAPWFPPPTPATFADQHRMQFAPPPELRGVGHPAPDRLWTISWVADPRWRESVRLVTANESQVLDWGLRFDTMIEFVDLTERGVLASLRLDTPGWGMLSDDEFWLREETADGQLRVVVVRMSLARPTPTLAKQ
jgi:hypothetical protein